MDAGYGSDTRLRTEIAGLGLCYIAGIQPHATTWPPWGGAVAGETLVGPWPATLPDPP